MIFNKKKFDGFTLFEMLLVLVIISSIIFMMMTYLTTKTDESKRDLTVMQYEQILNAGLAYYINNSAWPTTIDQLQTGNYLPKKTITNPWQSEYTFYNDPTSGTFSICSVVSGAVIGSGTTTNNTAVIESGIIAGRLPLAYTIDISAGTSGTAPTCPANAPDPTAAPCTGTGTSCALVSTVNIPGQNLNNARSVNFAGLYHNGACVPAPVCPNPYDAATNPTGMKPAIIVAPVAVSGNYEGGSSVFPVSSFTAYAVGGVVSASSPAGTPAAQPIKCTDSATVSSGTTCDKTNGGDGGLTSGTYWRVCLDVVTEKGRIGDVASEPPPPANPTVWDINSGTVMVITRCVPNNEPTGSGFNVFQSY